MTKYRISIEAEEPNLNSVMQQLFAALPSTVIGYIAEAQLVSSQSPRLELTSADLPTPIAWGMCAAINSSAKFAQLGTARVEPVFPVDLSGLLPLVGEAIDPASKT